MQVGDKVAARIEYGMEGGSLLPLETGTVVYIHPEKRFYTLEFTFEEGRRIRESYLILPPPESAPLPQKGLAHFRHVRGAAAQEAAPARGRWLNSI